MENLAILKNFHVYKKILRGKEDILSGLILYESGEQLKAESKFRSALNRLETETPNIRLSKEEWTYKGVAYHRLGRDYDAINCYDESIHGSLLLFCLVQ